MDLFFFSQGGAQFSAVCVGSYVNDAYQSISVEVFIIIMVIKNFLFYGFSRKFSSLVLLFFFKKTEPNISFGGDGRGRGKMARPLGSSAKK